MMDCPLTNPGPYTFTFRMCTKRAKDPADKISVHHSLDQSYEGLRPLRRVGDWVHNLKERGVTLRGGWRDTGRYRMTSARGKVSLWEGPCTACENTCQVPFRPLADGLPPRCGGAAGADHAEPRHPTHGAPVLDNCDHATGGKAKAWCLLIHAEASVSDLVTVRITQSHVIHHKVYRCSAIVFMQQCRDPCGPAVRRVLQAQRGEGRRLRGAEEGGAGATHLLGDCCSS